MSSQILNNILSSPEATIILKNILEKAVVLTHDDRILKEEKKQLWASASLKLKLKPMELNKLVKYKMEQELLYNELNFLESITHLLDE